MSYENSDKIQYALFKKMNSQDFSCVEGLLELSFSVDGTLLKAQSTNPHFLSALSNSLSIESGDFAKYNVKELEPGIFSMSLPALDFLNNAEVAVASLLMTAAEEVSEQYFNPNNTPAPQLAQWGNNLISLEKSLQSLGLTDRHDRGACSDAEWEGIGLVLLKDCQSPTASQSPQFKNY